MRILLRMLGGAQHLCSAIGTHIKGLILKVLAKISSELPRHGRLGSRWNIPSFWDPIWLPKLPSIFPGDFKNFQAFFHWFFVQ